MTSILDLEILKAKNPKRLSKDERRTRKAKKSTKRYKCVRYPAYNGSPIMTDSLLLAYIIHRHRSKQFCESMVIDTKTNERIWPKCLFWSLLSEMVMEKKFEGYAEVNGIVRDDGSVFTKESLQEGFDILPRPKSRDSGVKRRQPPRLAVLRLLAQGKMPLPFRCLSLIRG